MRGEADAVVEDAVSSDQQVSNIVKLWQYRRIILIAIVLGVVVTGLIYFLAPAEHLASLKFRLLFEGADKGEYPSGMRFSTDEIVAKPVLLTVYKANKLSEDRYGGFEDFQSSFYVATKPSAEMEALDSEYSSKLANRALTAVERTRLEEQYNDRRSGMLHGVEYELTIDLSLGLDTMPEELREKIIKDILRTWARDAKKRKGALKYQISILTKKFFPENIQFDGNHFMAADMLRRKARMLLDNIEELMELPGAKSYRSPTEDLSLGEVSAKVDDVISFNLLPAMYLARLSALADPKEGAMTALYVQAASHKATLAQKEAADRVKALQEALAAYMPAYRAASNADAGVKNSGTGTPSMSVSTIMPQFGDAYIDRIIQMATMTKDIEFRQEFIDRIIKEALVEVKLSREVQFYQDMLTALQDKGASISSLTPETRKQIDAHVKEAHKDLLNHVEQINTIYNELSETNLSPPTELYSAPEQIITTMARSISISRLVLYLVAIVGGMVVLTSAGCLYHARIRAQKSPAA